MEDQNKRTGANSEPNGTYDSNIKSEPDTDSQKIIPESPPVEHLRGFKLSEKETAIVDIRTNKVHGILIDYRNR